MIKKKRCITSRRMYTTSTATCRCATGVIITQFCLILYLQYSLHKSVMNPPGDVNSKQDMMPVKPEGIDIVYTWVNGSEERFLEQLHRIGANRGVKEDVNGDRRFAEKHELLYSLRSVEKHMPWIQHVYIVTNGQIPSWLNLRSGRVSVVPHEKLFANWSSLPTFSSPAIEANLHRIPGISKRFLYLNDDWLIGAPVEYSTFYTPTDGLLFYWEFAVPGCAHLCPWSKVANGHCDVSCYVPECHMDGGDCLEPPAMLGFIKPYRRVVESAYGASLQTTQRLLNENFGFHERYVMPHMPVLVDVEVMRDAWRDFPRELGNTSSHHFRDGTDLQFEFFYAFYTQEKTIVVTLSEALREHDINEDGVLNNEEVDLMIIRHSQSKDKGEFRRVLQHCTPNTNKDFNITLLESCTSLGAYLEKTLRTRYKYKSLLMTKVPTNGFYYFGSLESNLGKVVGMLNELRRHPRKFICLNDDLTHKSFATYTNSEIYKELARFYHNMFPEPSEFELPEGEVNPPGKYIQELTGNFSDHKYKYDTMSINKMQLGLRHNFGWVQYVVVLASLAILTFLVGFYRRRRRQFLMTKGTRATKPATRTNNYNTLNT